MKKKVTKLVAGLYRVSFANAPATRYTVLVEQTEWGWIDRAEWTNDTYSDPLPTKARAVVVAEEILDDLETDSPYRYAVATGEIEGMDYDYE